MTVAKAKVAKALYPDPFDVVIESPPLDVTAEQGYYIKKILDKACSDSRFADKAFLAIWKILTGGDIEHPVVVSLSPSSAILGDPSFDLHVIGTGFNPLSVIVFANRDELTTYVSPTELTTGVNMDLWIGPDSVPVAVRNAVGTPSTPVMFDFTEPILGATKKVTPIKPVEVSSKSIPHTPVVPVKK
jgi:hypothetical protein